MNAHIRFHSKVVLGAWAVALLASAGAFAADETAAPSLKVPAWDKSVVSMVQTLPVQDEGRIKPFDTYASFKLLKFNGRRSCTTPDGRKLNPVQWLIDVLFFPEVAQDYAIFNVDSSDVIVALGLVPHEKKRDRYSYRELQPGVDKLMELAGTYAHMSAKERSTVQSQIVNLAQNLNDYESIAGFMQFALKPFALPQCDAVGRLFPAAAQASLSEILGKASQIHEAFQQAKDKGDSDEAAKGDTECLTKLLSGLDTVRKSSTALALIPPSEDDEKEWLTPGDVVLHAFQLGAKAGAEIQMLASLEQMAESRTDPAQFKDHLAAFAKQVEQLASHRGEYSRIPLEVAFYKGQFFSRALMLYVLVFLLVAVSWMVPKSRALYRVSSVVMVLPTLMLVTGITMRCIIRGRPPVTTLYETILFVTAVAVVVSLFIEYMNRQRIALSVAAVLAVIGMFLANKYEAREGLDTMPSMVAVLDTNFWLATHVTTISMGYAAGLLSGAIAHVYIFGRLFGFKKNEPEFYRNITRMVYGVFAFGFFFAFVGTLLGGIWADQSWGRFWGWDPKENGALLICLWQLATLHALGGGYIRDLGLNIAAVACGMVVAFSWWAVNLLGVGLHSYGFSSGTMTSLIVFWSIEGAVIVLGLLVWARQGTLPAKATAR